MEQAWIPVIVYVIFSLILFYIFTFVINRRLNPNIQLTSLTFHIFFTFLVISLTAYGLYILSKEGETDLVWLTIILALLVPIFYFFLWRYVVLTLIRL